MEGLEEKVVKRLFQKVRLEAIRSKHKTYLKDEPRRTGSPDLVVQSVFSKYYRSI
jgi:hypothetical protein